MYYKIDDNNKLLLFNKNSIYIEQEKNPTTQNKFKSKEEAINFIKSFLKNDDNVLYDLDITVNIEDNITSIQILDIENILPKNIRIYLIKDNSIFFENVFIKKDNTINIELYNLENGEYYIDIDKFHKDLISYELFMSEYDNGFTIE